MFRAVETSLEAHTKCNCMRRRLGYQIECKCLKETKFQDGGSSNDDCLGNSILFVNNIKCFIDIIIFYRPLFAFYAFE